MKQLFAKDCLSKDIALVHEEDRPNIHSNYFAVFRDKQRKKFIGVVSRAKIIHPHRIFADLVSSHSPPAVLPDTPATVCEEKMRANQLDILAVLDEHKKFHGVVTYSSIASSLLELNMTLKATTIQLFDSLRLIVSGVEHYHDSYTLRHEENTGKMMRVIGQALGCNEQYCADLQQAGSLHDIGKLALPSHILDKQTKLNLFERDVIEMHPELGYKMLEKIAHPLGKFAANIALYHHENFDGTGYPLRIKKDQIPLEARICSLCDVYDAMRSDRPYHPATLSHEDTVKIILSKKSDGIFYKFDPTILEAFAEVHDEFDNIFSFSLKANSK
ncbi:HD domain-containing phosphohydrolase [Legionella impletisoli]|uniref:Metal dependent phosphohydrolase n=1 Tax=Legionella impletisoli TaxID=343510 RepID=A0A917JS25_9GAMM|nr:HD domain-containing phosphohydrolase [Legionella impletisoli]GGI81767.1 hypothetical protein GCM10007966_07890 [Legionella impletisoli]